MISRRQFLKLGLATEAALFFSQRAAFLERVYAQSLNSPAQQIPLDSSTIPQFVSAVPNLLDPDHLIVDDGINLISLEMKEQLVNILPAGAVPGYVGTYVWSYLKAGQNSRTSYLGPVVLATRGKPTKMKFANKLGNTSASNVLAYKNSTDQTLHWADPLNNEANMWNHMSMPPEPGSEGARNYNGSIPAVVHLHGGEVPPVLDGSPDAWYTSDGLHHGHAFYSAAGNAANEVIYRYPNTQEGSLIWFHDHTLGATRLNVYAGLAGGYLIADPQDKLLATLPTLFPLVIQDRMFDTNGQLFFPGASAGGTLSSLNPEHPYWVPEFVGDTIVVNGKSWPYMNVEPKRYTFLVINGSNSRTYAMSLVDQVSGNPGPALWVIGTDGGYLDEPVKLDPTERKNNALTMMSGERYWVIVDFKGFEAGVIGPNEVAYSGNWILQNTALCPYPAGDTPQPSTEGRIMQFRVAGGPVNDRTYNPERRATLRRPMVRLFDARVQKTRQLTLNEVMGMPVSAVDPVTGAMTDYPGGPLEILVNNTKWSGERVTGVGADGMFMMEPVPRFTLDGSGRNWLSELPKEGETEVWEIVNMTADAHPMHFHLVQVQLVNRQNFDVTAYTDAYATAFPAGFDHVMKTTMGPGVVIPSSGPPLDYYTGNARALGGNPDIAAVSSKKGGKPIYLMGRATEPLPQENGWKDTVLMMPGQVTRILVRWAPTDIPAKTAPAKANFPFDPNGGRGYVWHCHIVDHEDNEMMRPYEVVPNNVTRTYIKGRDY